MMKRNLLPLLLIFVLLLSGCTAPGSSQSNPDTLSDATATLQNEVDEIQTMLKKIGTSVGKSPAGDEKAYSLMNEQLNSKPYFFDILVTDADSNVTQVATKMDSPFIGLNLKSINRHPELFVDTPAMVIKPHTSTDDTPYLYASVPIENGGWVIAYIDPYTFGAELSKLAIGQNLDLGVIDTNGTNIYTSNMTEIGKNILTDPIYSSFVELQTLIKNKMIPDAQGEGTYTYNAAGTNEPVQKQVKWDTVNAFGSELRVYVNSEPGAGETTATNGDLRQFTEEELSWLDTASTLIYDEFTNLETLTKTAVTAYQQSGETSDAFSSALAAIAKESPIAKNVVFVNNENLITNAYPSYFKGISFDLYNKNIPAISQQKQPFITPLTFTDHQSPATQLLAFVTPVEKDGQIAGYIVAQVRLYDFAAYLTNLESIGENVNFMLTNNDGTILYDGDLTEIGMNTFEDDLYSEGTLSDYIHNEYKPNREGQSEYEFYGAGMTEIIPKRVVWKTMTFMWNDFKLSMNSEWKPGE
ncbi:hypothetical protein [Acetobacterium wieringae]|uniref:cache domain-containing protein n=1 Tax=Acetobacterium wieringae TaxID=52694 RepID=UPI0026EC0B60|nr:hypothetical protein [Acetobacterium wieringae]